MTGTRRLSDIGRGGRARIVSVDAAPATVRRLSELGLTPGLVVEIVHSSGGPLVVSARGSRVALDRRLAGNVAVAALPAADVEVGP